jgi:hypothetical protein
MFRCALLLNRVAGLIKACLVFLPATLVRHNRKLEGFNAFRIRARTSFSFNPN